VFVCVRGGAPPAVIDLINSPEKMSSSAFSSAVFFWGRNDERVPSAETPAIADNAFTRMRTNLRPTSARNKWDADAPRYGHDRQPHDIGNDFEEH
jgi:hypothetical protein